MSISRILSLRALLFCILIALSLFYFWLGSGDVLGGYGGDNAFYVMMAKSMSPYSETSDAAEYFATTSVYPLLYPLILAVFGGGESLMVGHMLTTAMLIFGLWMLAWWLMREGVEPALALLCSVVVAMCPEGYLQTMSMHSENLFIFLTVSVFCLIGADSFKDIHIKKIWGLVLIVAMVCAARTAGVALLAAVFALMLVQRRWDGLLPLIFIGLGYLAYSYLIGTDGKASYSGSLSKFLVDPTTLLESVKSQANALYVGWCRLWGEGRAALVVADSMLAMAALSLLVRLYRLKLDALYILAYLAMVLIWPFPAESKRFMFAILPVVMAQTFLTMRYLALPAFRLLNLASVGGLMLAITMAPSLMLTAERAVADLPEGLSSEYRHTRFWYLENFSDAVNQARWMAALEADIANAQRLVPESECIYSIKPSIIGFYSNRVSKGLPLVDISEEQFWEQIETGGCGYVYVLPFASPTYGQPFYPAQRLGSRAQQMTAALYEQGQQRYLGGMLLKLNNGS